MNTRLAPIWPPVLVGVFIMSLWEGMVRALDIKEFLLPKPSSIAAAVCDQWSLLRVAGWETGKTAVVGLLIGVITGAILALVVSRFGWLRGSVTPLAVALNATPIIALAPIFNAWFGITDFRSNAAVVIIIVFFPVFINTGKGLSEVEPNQIELMRSLAASETTVLRMVRIPNALPFFLTSLRLAAPLSVIAAIVAEYFGGPLNRLGPFITQNASVSRYANAWAAIVVASAIGLALFAASALVEKLAMPWKRPESTTI